MPDINKVDVDNLAADKTAVDAILEKLDEIIDWINSQS